MDLYENLKSRFPQSAREKIETAQYFSAIGRAEGASRKAAETTVAARLDPKLSALGRLEAIRGKLAADAVALARDLARAKAAPVKGEARRRELLGAAVAQPDSFSRAVVAAQLRDRLANLEPGRAVAMLADPKLDAAELATWMGAILEAPPSLLGLPADQMERILEAATQRLADPGKVQAVADHEAAAALAESAVKVALHEIQTAVALDHIGFIAWAIDNGAPAEAFNPNEVAAARAMAAGTVAKVGGAA